MGTRKRRIPPSQLSGKFSSKHDILKYLKEHCKYHDFSLTTLYSATVHTSRLHDYQRFPQTSSGGRKGASGVA